MSYIAFEISWVSLAVALVGFLAGLSLIFLGLSRIMPKILNVTFTLIGVGVFTLSAAFAVLQFSPLAHQAQVAEKLSEHYGISVDPFQVGELGYPSERPTEGTAFAYGTIKVDSKDLTLIWDGQQIQLGEKSDGRDPYIFLEPRG